MGVDRAVLNRLAKGSSANALGQAVIVTIQLAGVPILLHFWGARLYGEWLVLFAIPAYLAVGDLGFSQSAGNDMTARLARGDKSKALVIFQSMSTLVYLSVAFGALVVSVLVVFLPLDGFLGHEELTTREVRWVIWLLTFEVLIRLLDGINHAGFRANGDYAFHMVIYYLTLLAQNVGIWIVAAMGYGAVSAAASFVFIRIVVTPIVALWLLRRHTWLHFGFKFSNLRQLKLLLKPALANVSLPLAQALNIQGMVIVVGAILGPLAVVAFSTLRTMARFALQVVFSIVNAVEPEMSIAYGKDDLNLLRSLYFHVLRAGLWLVISVAVALAFSGDWILGVWTHEQVAMHSFLFYFLLLSAVVNVLWYVGFTMLKAANRHLKISLLNVFSAGGAVALGGLLLEINDNLDGLGIVLLLTDIFMLGCTLLAVANFYGRSIFAGFWTLLNPMFFLNTKTLKKFIR